MAHITLNIPKELYILMKKYREVDWSEVARKAILEKLLTIKAKEKLPEKNSSYYQRSRAEKYLPRTIIMIKNSNSQKKLRRKKRRELNTLKSWRSLDTRHLYNHRESQEERRNKRKHHLNHSNRIPPIKDYEKFNGKIYFINGKTKYRLL